MRAGQWNQAHNLVQLDDSSAAARLHALLHVQEGDLEDAEHWYGKAGRNFRGRGARSARNRLITREHQPLLTSHELNRAWALDVMRDTLYDGRPFRTLNVIAEGHREALRIECGTSIPSARVVRVMEQLIEVYGKPEAVAFRPRVFNAEVSASEMSTGRGSLRADFVPARRMNRHRHRALPDHADCTLDQRFRRTPA